MGRHSLFFNDSGAKAIYKDYVRAIITRKNTVNGRLYSHDPTIMAWGLLNEPRCETWMVSRFGGLLPSVLRIEVDSSIIWGGHVPCRCQSASTPSRPGSRKCPAMSSHSTAPTW